MKVGLVLRLAALPLIFGLIATSPAIAYSSPDGDQYYIDNYDTNNDYEVVTLKAVKAPVPKPTEDKCSPSQQAMFYNDYVDNGHGMN